MEITITSRLCLTCLLGATGPAYPQAGGTDAPRHLDHTQVRMLVQSRTIHPLRWVLDRVPGRDRYRVVGVELEAQGGRYVYEIQTLDARGSISRLRIDASDGTLLDPPGYR